MAISELVGEKCRACGGVWKSTNDFDRMDVFDAFYVPTPELAQELDAPDGTVLKGTFWMVRCNLPGCGQTKPWLYFVNV